jgi:hypothetical protein
VIRQIQARLGTAATVSAAVIAVLPAIALAAHHKPSPETLLARKALLRTSDIGTSWRSTAAPKQVPTLTCPAFSPDLGTLPKPGAAVSPTFQQTANGPFVSQTAYAFPKASQALTFWHRVVTHSLGKCVAGGLTASSTQTVNFKANHTRSLPLPAIADRRAGYRVIGTASTTAQQITVYLDMIVVGRGSELSQISFTSFEQPPPRSLELRLARLVAARLPADQGGSNG